MNTLPPVGEGATHLTPEQLMQYLDGELSPEARAQVEASLETDTELRRELMAYRRIHEDLSQLRLRTGLERGSLWGQVHRRLSRPMGWIFLGAGGTAWILYATWIYFSSAIPTPEKLMTGAVVIGILLLFASVIHDRYREWLTDPYRNVER
jgi:hypothetical protein